MANNFKDKLKARRKKFTQQGVASRLGISQSTVSKVCSGKRNPETPLAKRIRNLMAKI